MNYTVEWYDDEQRTILRTLKPGWTWDEFVQAFADVFDLVRSVKHRVDVIFDEREAPTAPGVGALEHFAEARQMQPENVGWFVVVGADPFMEEMGKTFVANFMGDVPGFRAFFVDSMEEALRILSDRDE